MMRGGAQPRPQFIPWCVGREVEDAAQGVGGRGGQGVAACVERGLGVGAGRAWVRAGSRAWLVYVGAGSVCVKVVRQMWGGRCHHLFWCVWRPGLRRGRRSRAGVGYTVWSGECMLRGGV